ncbi:hypothetical protein OG252_12985 [Streptomyces sp. NBC_01352]|uniref:hypothetical protein n=1 Tax=Streptomyces sp. NBC_01352 TaxID=2903834 RepID=UPI002E37811B|nr:hypothetical protein [Streptomyces sp. NBC_01352]
MSAIDARARIVAAEVFAELAGGQATAEAGPDRVAELEKQVAELAARVDKLEKAPQRAATAKRTSA